MAITQGGLRGVSFGDSLIKHVVDVLKAEFPHLKTFATLSPIPGFRAWLGKNVAAMMTRLDEKARTEIKQALHSNAELTAQLLTPDAGFTARVQDHADVPVDPAYAKGTAANYVTTGGWDEQSHLFADVAALRTRHLLYAVLWPERAGFPATKLSATLKPDGSLVVQRPDGRTDTIRLTDEHLSIE